MLAGTCIDVSKSEGAVETEALKGLHTELKNKKNLLTRLDILIGIE